MSDTIEPAGWKVWILGILCCAPVCGLPLGCILSAALDMELIAFIIMTLYFPVLPGIALIFILRIWRKPRLDRSTKVFWSLGLLFFTAFAVPYYWYKFHWQPYRARKLYANI